MATAITCPDRAFTSFRFEIVFSYLSTSSGLCVLVAMNTTGRFSSISAFGPCFISPAG